MWRAVLVALAFVALLAACGEGATESAGSTGTTGTTGSTQSAEGGPYDAYPAMDNIPKGEPWVIIATNHGRMSFALFHEEAPLAVNNFIFLANEGYFDDVTFHRLIPGFMVQGGDPSGTGTGGPGYSFEIELPQRPYIRGGLAMANKGTPDSNGSQFFIILDDLTAQDRLPPDFTLFGQLKDEHKPSVATLEKIEAVPVAEGSDGEGSVPQEEIKIISVTVGAKFDDGCSATWSAC